MNINVILWFIIKEASLNEHKYISTYKEFFIDISPHDVIFKNNKKIK